MRDIKMTMYQETYVKVGRARDNTGYGEHWKREEVNPTLNLFDMPDSRSVTLIVCVKNESE